LPFFRCAPGQSGCWGWPVTSGNPEVTSYLSCEQLEPANGSEHYTEKLVLLKHLPTYYSRPPLPNANVTRDRLTLRGAKHVYLCTQNLRKYHPDFDALLGRLLRCDPEGVVLVIGDRQQSITQLLVERFRRTIRDVMPRLAIVPWMNRTEYLALVAAADVALDTLHYGGGANTVYDAVAVGTPIVTLPGEFHRSRWAAAVNRRLGLSQLIASTPESTRPRPSKSRAIRTCGIRCASRSSRQAPSCLKTATWSASMRSTSARRSQTYARRDK
jgi:predicted O-linked N-acetylglucosamine transferase (SPINDLY family)